MQDYIKHIDNKFKALQFDEELHLYNVESKSFTSVSRKIDNYVHHPDFDKIAGKIANIRQVSKQSILDEWEEIKNEACERGTRVHLFGEKYVFDRTLKPSCKQEEAIVKFWNDLPSYIVPAFIELRMYHPLLAFAGTSDILLFNQKSKKFIIADYKTNKDLFKNFKEKTLLYPFNDLLDCPLNKYQIQLSFYQILFELTGYKVESRKIIWLLKDGNYKMYDGEDFSNRLINNLTQQN